VQRSALSGLRPPDSRALRALFGVLTGLYLATVALATVAPEAAASVFLQIALVFDGVTSGKVWMLASYALFHDLNFRAPLLDLALGALLIAGLVVGLRSEFGRRETGVVFIGAFVGMLLLQNLGYGAVFHLLGNLLTLWFFAPEFARRWGDSQMLRFFAGCVVGGAVFASLVSLIAPGSAGFSVLGASAGAIGLLTAFAVYFPDVPVFASMLVPVKAKHLVLIVVLFDLVSAAAPGPEPTLWLHLGGIGTAFLVTTGYWRPKKLRDRFAGTSPARKSHLRVVKKDDWIH
jgi:Rhomboid family